MKKFLAILIILGMLLGLLIFAIPTSEKAATETPQDNTITGSLNDAEYKFEDDIASEDVLVLSESTGDLNADGKQDRGVVLSVTGSGTGVFIYVAASVSGPVGYQGSNAVYLGDRVKPESISIKDGILTVRYLGRSKDEPFSDEPTVSMSKEFVYLNGELRAK